MTGEPAERKPCTSSGPLPPIQTVAPKLTAAVALWVFVALVWERPIPQEGSATRSGSTDRDGLASVGTLGADGSGRGAGRAPLPDEGGPLPATTWTFTLAVAAPAPIPNSCRYWPVIDSVTVYVPSGSVSWGPAPANPPPTGSMAQPLAMPQMFPIGNGSMG